MEKKSWIGYNVSVDGGGLVALVPNRTHYSAQMDAIEYQGLDIPAMGPGSAELDYTVITELLSLIEPVPLRGEFGDLAVDRAKELITGAMMNLLSLTREEMESSIHVYDIVMPDIGPGKFQIIVKPVVYEWVDDTGWVISNSSTL